MNKLLIFLFFLFSTLQSFGQKNQLTETDSLYFTALKKYVSEVQNYYKQEELNTIYLDNFFYTDFLPDSIDGHPIIKVGLGNQKKIFRQNKNKLRLVRIFPINIKSGEFSITIAPYFAELKRRGQLELSLSNWTQVFFRFTNGRLEYFKTENGGI